MFTGLIQDIGRLVALNKQGDWIATLATTLSAGKLTPGASIACDGICLTVIEEPHTEKDRRLFKVQIRRKR